MTRSFRSGICGDIMSDKKCCVCGDKATLEGRFWSYWCQDCADFERDKHEDDILVHNFSFKRIED